jgi:hypothetical protein
MGEIPSGLLDAQTPLSLRYETKVHWPDFRRELGVNETGAAIILAACAAEGDVSYSRTAGHYDRPARYRLPLYTWRRVVDQIDLLDASDLIYHDRRPPGERGWQSSFAPKPELVAIHDRILCGSPPVLAKPREVIVLRGADRGLLDYRDTRETNRQRRNVEAINEAIGSSEIDPRVKANLCRIFNLDMRRGGRFYGVGNSWQNIPAEARKDITIDGERVDELDYKTLHPAMLYAEAGHPLPADCYDIEPWPRPLVKVALLIMINAPTIHGARHAIAHCDQMAEPNDQAALRAADALIKAIKRRHAPIAGAFHSDAGARLMHRDSAIADRVMMDLLAEGVVALPVHDSFLVAASQRDRLEAAMMRAAHKAGLPSVQICGT